MSFWRAHAAEMGILILALAARFFYLWLSYNALHTDLPGVLNAGDGYFDIAQNLIAGHGYSIAHQEPFVPTSYRTPGMPYFIAGAYALFHSWFGVIALHIIVGSLVPLLGMRLAYLITGSRKVCIAVGIFCALEPTGILLSDVLLSETLFAFVFLSALLIFYKYLQKESLLLLSASALLFGFSILVRPSVEYLPVFLVAVIVIALWGKPLTYIGARAALFTVLCALVLAPWVIRNYREFGAIGLSSQQGAALYAVTVPSVLAAERHTAFAEEYNTEIAGPNDADFVQSVAYTKIAIPILLAHPVGLALVSANTGFSFMTYDGVYDVLRRIGFEGNLFETIQKTKLSAGMAPDAPTLLMLSHPLLLLAFLSGVMKSPLALIFAVRAVWFVAAILFVMGVWRLMRQKPRRLFASVAFIVVIYLLLTTILTGFTVNYRYRMPVNSLILAFAVCEGLTLVSLANNRYRLQTRHVI